MTTNTDRSKYQEERPLPVLRPWHWYYRTALWLFKGSAKRRLFTQLARVLRKPNVNLNLVIKDLFWRSYEHSKWDSSTLVLNQIALRLEASPKVKDAFADICDPIERMLLQGGESGKSERTGDFEEVRSGIQRAFEHCLKRAQDARNASKKVRAALMTATVYFLMTVSSLYVFALLAVPQIAVAFPPSAWDSISYSMYVASEVVMSTPFSVGMVMTLLMFAIYPFVLPRWVRGARVTLDRYPPFSFYRLQQGGGWLASLPALTESGALNTYDAMVQTRALAGPWLRDRISRVIARMEGGKDLSVAMHQAGQDFPDREIIADMRLYERNGMDTDEVIKEVAAEWSETGIEMIESQAAKLQRISAIVFAIIVMWVTVVSLLINLEMPAYFNAQLG